MTLLLYLLIFIYGIVIGSFLNVCILRIPRGESVVTVRSHCMSCGYQLKWYDLFPLFSWIFLRGRCRSCGSPISIQYPLIEGANGLLYLLIFGVKGMTLESVIYALMASALLALSIIDFRTFEIPTVFPLFIGGLGVIRIILDWRQAVSYFLGFLSVSLFLLLLYWITKGNGIGGGDIKLMAACGLLLGWKCNILAFFIGCILASVIHLLRMKLAGADHKLALGPYLSAGVILAALFGEQVIDWYLRILGV